MVPLGQEEDIVVTVSERRDLRGKESLGGFAWEICPVPDRVLKAGEVAPRRQLLRLTQAAHRPCSHQPGWGDIVIPEYWVPKLMLKRMWGCNG